MNNPIQEKIKKLRELAKIAKKLKKEGKKTVLCHGVFDLVHPGHIRYLHSAKKQGDILVVSLTADKYVKKGPGRPIFNQNLRAEVLSSLENVDYVTIVESETAIEAIKKIKPDVYVKGPDYKKRKQNILIPRKLEEEEAAIQSVGGKLIFTEDEIVFSSSRLINEYLDLYPIKTRDYLEDLKQKYTADYILDRLASLRKIKVLVIGDAIIDQYHYCLPMGRSSKEPVMVHQYISEETFLGGTLMTANHVASLSSQVALLTVLGKEKSFKNFILRHLKKEVSPVFFHQPNHQTIIKRRFLDAFTKQKLFQLSVLKDDLLAEKIEKEVVGFLKKEIKNYDLVIVNDFGHGMMTEKIIRLICQKANFLALNVQANSANYGFNIITKYPKAEFICIDTQELRLATHDRYSGLPILIKKIYKKMRCNDLIVTKGADGSISFSKEMGFLETPALTERIVDRVGAGDALFAICAPCIYASFERDLISFVGNVAGALHVQIVGNKKPVEFGEMAKFIARLLK